MAERPAGPRLAQLLKRGSVRRAGCRPHRRPSLLRRVGQASADGKISPEEESRLLTNLLTYWALKEGTLDMSELCASQARARIAAPSI